jgi:hypothetical protein
MEAFLITEPFHHIVFRNFFTEEELELVWKEIDLISRPGVFLSPLETGAAHEEDQKPLSKRSAVFLDLLYIYNRSLSPILSFNRKIFEEGVINPEESWFFKNLAIRRDDTLLSYYEDGDYYEPHCDESALTGLTWIFKEPKAFQGGDLLFSDYSYSIECEYNSGVIFPSQIKHAVYPVKMAEDMKGKKMGRYCVTSLMYPDRRKLENQKQIQIR